jgi:hypothetical protein
MLADSKRVEEKDKTFTEDVTDGKYSNYLFTRLIAKGRRFTKVDFKYTTFDSCYLRNCVFDSCDFTGCRFVSTSLYGSSFAGCKFDYASFERTLIDSDLLDSSCPAAENLKARFARSLRMNFQQIGDPKGANRAIAVELQATEIHLRKAWGSNESYYRKKYRGWRRTKSFLEWVGFKVLDFIWGNGESILKLLRFVVVAILAMAIMDVIYFGDADSVRAYLDALVTAPAIFFGVVSPPGYSTLYLTLILAVRLTAFAFFISIIIKRFNRR